MELYLKSKRFKESKLLRLNSNKSQKLLSWNCILNIKKTIHLTLDWYKFSISKKNKKNLYDFSVGQIKEYQNFLK